MASGSFLPRAEPTDKPGGSPKRLVGIDLVRVLGVAAVVVGHSVVSDAGWRAIALWHVPIFFFISGYFWRSGTTTVRDEIRKRGKTLAVPYVAWWIIVAAVWSAVQIARGDFQPYSLVKAAYGGAYATAPFSAFWFISALFFVAVFYRMIDGLPRAWQWAIAVGALAAMTVAGGILSKAPLAVASGVGCLVFVLAGRTFREHEHRIRAPRTTALIVIAVCAVLLALKVIIPFDLKNGNFGTPVLSVVASMAICCALLILGQWIGSILPSKGQDVVIALAAPALAVVLVHALLLALLRLAEVPVTVAVIATLVISWTIALVVDRVPKLGFLTGRG